MRKFLKVFGFAVVCMAGMGSLAQTKINPVSQINWPLLTGAGTPTSLSIVCTSANYGQPFQDTVVTPNTYYTCGTDGWAIRGGSGAATVGPQYAVPSYSTSPTGTTLGPSNIAVDSTGNNLAIPGSATVGPPIYGYKVAIGPQSAIPANIIYDDTTAATFLSSLGGLPLTGGTMTGPLVLSGTGTSTLPVCPNGYGGALTITGCVNGSGGGLGTMSTQNANAVAITGGAIDGTRIGATTQGTGAFTALSSTELSAQGAGAGTASSLLLNTTQATSSSNQSSPLSTIEGSIWNGSIPVNDTWTEQDVVGSGTNPTSTLTFVHAGSSGASAISVSALTIPGCSGQYAKADGTGCGTPTVGSIAKVMVALPTAVVLAGTCSTTAFTASMPGVIAPVGSTPGSTFTYSFVGDVTGVVGYGSSGGLNLVAWPTANQFNAKLCNPTGLSITSGAASINVGAQ